MAQTSSAVERDPTVEEIGRELRCPVCQGMPIGESPSEMAQAMMQRVRELHAEGKSRDEIRDYFVARYGEWVLLRPEARGFNLLVWVLPPVVLVAGLFIVVLYVRRTRAQAGDGSSRPDSSEAPPLPTSTPTPASAPAPAPAPTEDPYLRQVRESLEKGDV